MAAQEKNRTNLFTHDRVHAFIDSLFGEDLHAKRVLSLADSTLGVVHAASLGVHAIGRGLAAARGLADKHAIKQVDRCIGNEKIDMDVVAPLWIAHAVGDCKEVIVNLDWTEFDDDDQSMLVASLQTDHGRALPLLWKTVVKSKLKGQRNDHEDALLCRLRDAVPRDVRVVIVADRGFGDQKLFEFLTKLDFHYIIRFRACIQVTDQDGVSRAAGDWLGEQGRLRSLRHATVTANQTAVGMVVVVHEKNMDEPWCLVASDPAWSGSWVKQRYGKRFTCEETFRDVKDLHFGFGMSWNPVTQPARRDRMMLLATLAQALLTILGAAGEAAGIDYLLKANTTKKRTMSLLRQGIRWYELIPNMPESRLRVLMDSFESLVTQSALFRALLAVDE
jgi:hypothetical protein